jgi:hypothetical protein
LNQYEVDDVESVRVGYRAGDVVLDDAEPLERVLLCLAPSRPGFAPATLASSPTTNRSSAGALKGAVRIFVARVEIVTGHVVSSNHYVGSGAPTDSTSPGCASSSGI